MLKEQITKTIQKLVSLEKEIAEFEINKKELWSILDPDSHHLVLDPDNLKIFALFNLIVLQGIDNNKKTVELSFTKESIAIFEKKILKEIKSVKNYLKGKK